MPMEKLSSSKHLVSKLYVGLLALCIVSLGLIPPTACSVITQNVYTPYYVDSNSDIYNSIDISVTQYADTSGEIPQPNGNFSLYLSRSTKFNSRDGGVRKSEGVYNWSFYPYRSNWWEDTQTSTPYTEASYWEVFIDAPFTSRDGRSFNETKTYEDAYLREVYLVGNFYLQSSGGFVNKRDLTLYVELYDGSRVPIYTSSWDSVSANYLEINIDDVNIPCKDIRGFTYAFKYGGFGGASTRFEFQLDPSSYLGVFNSTAYVDDIVNNKREEYEDLKNQLEQQIQDAIVDNPDIDFSYSKNWERQFSLWDIFIPEVTYYGWFNLLSEMVSLSLTVSIIAIILHGRR